MVWAPLNEPTYRESENRPGVMTLSASPVALDATSFHALSPLRFPPP
jgi:hypothetical protein